MNFGDIAEQWLTEGNIDALRRMLAGYPQPGELSKRYKACFPRHSPEAAKLAATTLAGLSDERILERLDKIFQERPDVIRQLVRGWLDTSNDALAQLADGEWPFSEEAAPRKEWWEAVLALAAAAGIEPRWEWLVEIIGKTPAAYEPATTVKNDRPESSRRDAEIRILRRELNECKKNAGLEQVRAKEVGERVEKLERELAIKARQLESTLLAAKSLERDFLDIEQQAKASARRIKKLEKEVADLKTKLAGCRAALEEERKPCPEPAIYEQPHNAPEAPFDPDDLRNVWVIPYSSLAEEPRRRLLTLIGLYRAALEGENEQALLSKTNWGSINGKPQGILLMDTDRLLHDMVQTPLVHWLETSLFDTEAYLHALRNFVENRLLENNDG